MSSDSQYTDDPSKTTFGALAETVLGSVEGLEAIILAGGLGTRLRETVPDLPKCMAPVAGRPFLFYVINYLRSQGVHRFIFSLGYKHEIIEQYLEEQFSTLSYLCSIEEEPLGTGGAIKLACTMSTVRHVLVVNGDTLFKIKIKELINFHLKREADCTLALRPMNEFDRYGVVEIDKEGAIQKFSEKKYYTSGLINGGMYMVDTEKFGGLSYPPKFSFEKDHLEKITGRLYGYAEYAYFIDIGIPADLDRAGIELTPPPLQLKKIDRSWTLFLDRDGVINVEKKDDYIRNRHEFHFYEGATEAIIQLGKRFGKIIIVSNQRGVGKTLMSEADLIDIHTFMTGELKKQGGRVDAIYYCTSTDNKHPDRKPNPGMAFKASIDITTIDLTRSVVAGNKLTDMQFGRNAGMYTVFISTTHPETPYPHPDIDLRFNSLTDLAKAF